MLFQASRSALCFIRPMLQVPLPNSKISIHACSEKHSDSSRDRCTLPCGTDAVTVAPFPSAFWIIGLILCLGSVSFCVITQAFVHLGGSIPLRPLRFTQYLKPLLTCNNLDFCDGMFLRASCVVLGLFKSFIALLSITSTSELASPSCRLHGTM